MAGLRTARGKWGPQVSVIDLSVGGVRFEIPRELSPGSTVALEFSGSTKTVLRTAQIIRCQTLHPIDSTARSEAAGAFRRPFPVAEFAGETRPGERPAQTTRDDDRAWQQVVGKCPGRIDTRYRLRPMNPSLHSPTPYAEGSGLSR
jgi:hypothetical protein